MEWLRETQWLAWLGVALVLGLVEIASLDLVFIMLSAGALAGAVVALAGFGFPVQVLVASGTAALLLAVARPVALRKLKPADQAHRTGTDAHVGRRAEVIRPVSERGGLVKLVGEEWSARTETPGATFAAGELVAVVRIEGATAVVEALPGTTSTEAEEPR